MIFKIKSFTLIEIIIVIIIIGILAALAVNQYTPARERAVSREAVSTLRLVAAAERIYRMEIGGFYPPVALSPVTTPKDINDNLKVSVNENNWDYSISSTAINNFTSLADRLGTGGFLDCQYSIDELNAENHTADCLQ